MLYISVDNTITYKEQTAEQLVSALLNEPLHTETFVRPPIIPENFLLSFIFHSQIYELQLQINPLLLHLIFR